MYKSLFSWVERLAQHRHATKALALVSFVEASFFPIPPFVIIIAQLAHERKPSWIRLALIGAVASTLGGLFGYCVGKFFYALIGQPLVAFYGLQTQIGYLQTVFNGHVFLTILLASLTPLPYKVFTISAGLFSVNVYEFMIASFVGRGIRFFIVSYLADRYGIHAKRFFVEQQKATLYIFLAVLILTIGYFLL